MKKVEKDHLPVEVAIEMLTDPKARLSNRDRKMYMRARQTEWVGGQPRKPLGEKLRNRARSKAIQWLDRERKRALRQRRGVQLKYEALQRLKSNPIIERFIAALDLRAAHLDTVLDSVIDEIQYRLDLTKGITNPPGALVLDPASGLQRIWVAALRKKEFPRWVAVP